MQRLQRLTQVVARRGEEPRLDPVGLLGGFLGGGKLLLGLPKDRDVIERYQESPVGSALVQDVMGTHDEGSTAEFRQVELDLVLLDFLPVHHTLDERAHRRHVEPVRVDIRQHAADRVRRRCAEKAVERTAGGYDTHLPVKDDLRRTNGVEDAFGKRARGTKDCVGVLELRRCRST